MNDFVAKQASRVLRNIKSYIKVPKYTDTIVYLNVCLDLGTDTESAYLFFDLEKRSTAKKGMTAKRTIFISMRGSRLHSTATSRDFESKVTLQEYDLAPKEMEFGRIQRYSITLDPPKSEMLIRRTIEHDPDKVPTVMMELHGRRAERTRGSFIDTALHLGEGGRGSTRS